jgi:hypothetical protein
MLSKLGLSGACALVLLTTAAVAEDQPGRYTMTPTEGGFVRLDKETGAMSVCKGKDGDWSCQPMPDGQKELQSKIDELAAENKALKEQKKALAEADRTDANPEMTPPPEPPAKLPMPTEDDVDKLFDYVEGMVKKFKERIQRLEKEAQKEETPL